MQTLTLDNGAQLTASQWFEDSGVPNRYVLGSGGQSMLMSAGTPAFPRIGWRKDTEAVFFGDGTLVTDPNQIDTHPGIPEALRPRLRARVVAQATWSPHSVAEMPAVVPSTPAAQADAKAQARAAQNLAKLNLEPGRVRKSEPLPAE